MSIGPLVGEIWSVEVKTPPKHPLNTPLGKKGLKPFSHNDWDVEKDETEDSSGMAEISCNNCNIVAIANEVEADESSSNKEGEPLYAFMCIDSTFIRTSIPLTCCWMTTVLWCFCNHTRQLLLIRGRLSIAQNMLGGPWQWGQQKTTLN